MLFLCSRERMAAQFPANLISNLSDNFNLGGVIKLRVLQLMDGMLMVNGISGQMNQVTRVITE